MHEARASSTTTGGSNTSPTAVDHLQAAALELIETARAFHDSLEDLVSDRERMAETVDAVGSVASAAARAAGFSRTATGSADAGPDGEAPGEGADRPPVEHIPVS